MKKFLVTVAAVGMMLTSWVQAEGDPQAGKNKVAACGACHGADGNSTTPTFPKLAGQSEKYLLKQLEDIRCASTGAAKCTPRNVPTMMGQLDNMSDQDLEDIAAYYASQTSTPAAAKKESLEVGAKVYRFGIQERNIPACTACHSPTGQGMAQAGFPKLSGQHADYIAAQLKAYRLGADQPDNAAARTNDGDAKIMRMIAKSLTDKEIDAVSSYASGLR